MRLGTADTAAQTAIIAEIGNNHEGDVGAARELVEQAAAAGAHAVKLQVMVPRQFVAPSQSERIAQLERYALGPDAVHELHELAHARGIGFVCSAFDLDSIALVGPLVDAMKVASGDNDVDVLLEAAAAAGKPMIVSTGMSTWDDITHTHRVVRAATTAELALLHCVSAYPTADARAQLATIGVLRERFPDATVGYSDHTLGLDACLVATALGARLLEKHFTLRRGASTFRDHELSLVPAELEELVERVARVEALVGTPRTGLQDEEAAVATAARRSPRAARALPAAHVVAPEDVIWMRPRDTPARNVVGVTLGSGLRYGDPIP